MISIPRLAFAASLLLSSDLHAAAPVIVDVIGDNFEYAQNSEPSLTVNPANPQQIFLHAFGDIAQTSPIFYSSNGGAAWSEFAQISTLDATLAWPSGGSPYLAHLSGETYTGLVVRKTATPPAATGTFDVLPAASYLPLGVPDQPWIVSTRVNNADRLYIGIDDFSQISGRTASVQYSLDGGATFSRTVIEAVTPPGGFDTSPVRVAVNGETVYALFARVLRGAQAGLVADLVVVKDTAGGLHQFKDLGFLGSGIVAARGAVLPQGSLGQERLGSDLSLAVSPTDPLSVYLAFAVNDADSRPSVAVYHSVDGGTSWQQLYQTRDRAALPALAVAQNGTVGLLYTGYFFAKLETHLAQTTDNFAHVTDVTLSRFVDSSLSPDFDPYIGDYEQLTTVGNNFYGTYSASNDVSLSPLSVAFLRDKTLLGTRVPFSIDPFFFSVAAQTSVITPSTVPTAYDDDLVFQQIADAFVFATLNDVDPSGDLLTVKSVDQPAHGHTVKAGSGSVVYTPNATFKGTDSFTYTAVNGIGQSASATVNVRAPFFIYAGPFVGAVVDSPATQSARGLISFTLTRFGDFTGTLRLAAKTYAFRGNFSLDGQAVAIVQLPQGPISIVLNMNTTTGVVAATISNGSFHSAATLQSTALGGALSAQRGTYNFALLHPGNLMAGQPAGDGCGTVVVAANGALRATGKLGDGTRFSQGVSVGTGGAWAIYAPLYAGLGSLSGTANFVAQADRDLTASSLAWIRPNTPADPRFKTAFTLAPSLIGAKYTAPTAGSPRLILAAQSGLGAVAFGSSDVSGSFSLNFQISSSNKITADPAGTDSLVVNLNPVNGLFTGSVKPPSTSTVLTFTGLLVPKANEGYGLFLTKSNAAAVHFTHR